MRNPVSPTTSQTTFFYNGTWAAGGYDQSGGNLYHRKQGTSTWSTNALSFDSEHGDNKYWQASIAGDTYAGNDVVEYYFLITYASVGHDDTWLGSTNNINEFRYGLEADAQNNPFTVTYQPNLGNAFHIPANTEPPGTTMRDPLTGPNAQQSVICYNGNQFQGAGNPGDQTGGYLIHKLAAASTWSSNAFQFHSTQGNNKYWFGEILGDTYMPGDTVDYYLSVEYTNDFHNTTYLATTNAGVSSTAFGSESTARSNPFSFTYSGDTVLSAAFMWHADNRVVSGNDVEVWTKIGYAQGTGSNRWVDFAAIYYTTNGVDPLGSYGVAQNADTLVETMSFSHMEQDEFEGGDAMWWHGTLNGMPDGQTVKYLIGSWKSTNGTERFADFNAGTDSNVFSFVLGVTPGDPELTVNGKNANYTTTKFFLDEITGDTAQVTVRFKPNDALLNPSTVQMFSNLDRRDFWNADIDADGIADAIKPPNADLITPATTDSYFAAHSMTNLGGGEFEWIGNITRCGAYRITARYQRTGESTWRYYTDTTVGRRDHAVVASPKKALEMTLYEINALTIEAQGADEAGRSTFIDLLSAAEGDNDTYDPFNLDHLNFLQANCLWFQPIHPQGIDRAGADPVTGSPYQPGSPYATRDYWAVSQYMGDQNTEADAMTEFQTFVTACDNWTGTVGTVNIMLDGVFNHTSWDAEYGQGGVDLGFTSDANQRIGATRPGWYARITDYGLPATFYNNAFDNDFATAPDRGDFGKWDDVCELYFGDYASLVHHNIGPMADNENYLNEGDWYDYGTMSSNVVELWEYFGYYAPYWLDKTGHPGSNTFNLAQDDLGIDGLRCDFGQGLPPQIWEYLINSTRSVKWNFIFMAETLDGGIPGYRSNRHFDILNENLVFQFTQTKVDNSFDLRAAMESRRTAYDGGAILLNLTGHDEVMPDNDPWVTFSRYGTVSSVDGLPMLFNGQEHGIGLYDPGDPGNWKDGFSHHELNFGKWIVHFKTWNQMRTWFEAPPDAVDLDTMYGRVNWARHNSPALRSQNRYFLSTTDSDDNAQIFAVAKYETPSGDPAVDDVVLCFVNMLRHGQAHSAASDTYDLQGAWSLLGLDVNKDYNIRNLAASDPTATIWPAPMDGQTLFDNGLFVSLAADTGPQPITTDGALVQYLKIEPVLTIVPPILTDIDTTGSGRDVTIDTEPGHKYTIYFTDEMTGMRTWLPFSNAADGIGTFTETAPTSSVFTFQDDESANTTGGASSNNVRNYRVEAEAAP